MSSFDIFVCYILISTISLHAPLCSLPVADFVWLFGAREHRENASSAAGVDQNSDAEGQKTKTMIWKTQNKLCRARGNCSQIIILLIWASTLSVLIVIWYHKSKMMIIIIIIVKIIIKISAQHWLFFCSQKKPSRQSRWTPAFDPTWPWPSPRLSVCYHITLNTQPYTHRELRVPKALSGPLLLSVRSKLAGGWEGPDPWERRRTLLFG